MQIRSDRLTHERVRGVYKYFSRVYDVVSPLWRDVLAREAQVDVAQTVAAYLPPDGSVLDLGCGTGANLQRLLALHVPFGEYLGLDLSENMLAVARRKFAGIPNAAFRQADALVDPLPQSQYDLAVSTWMLSHLDEPAKVVERALPCLKPGGYMVLLDVSEGRVRWSILGLPVLELLAFRPLTENEILAFPGSRVRVSPHVGGAVTVIVLRRDV
jgi:ubiquinone/menaquinone biosynthesis C-methylase UbiE